MLIRLFGNTKFKRKGLEEENNFKYKSRKELKEVQEEK
jgi:hypothetical protein